MKFAGYSNDKHTFVGRKMTPYSLAIVPVALLPIAIILTIITPSLVHYLPTLDVYVQFNIKSVEASTPAQTTTTNATNATTPQNTAMRSYVNPVFGISVNYPSTWSAFELNSRFRDNVTYAVALLRAPLENSSDKFAERVYFGMQNMKLNNMTLEAYTSKILDAYKNNTGIKIQESAPTTLAGQPAHRIVYTDDRVNATKLKKIQVWTVVDKNKAYLITFASEDSKFADYLPEAQNIMSSFKATTSSIDNPRQLRNLTFDDPMFGIKLEYPSSWTKIQPGQSSPQSSIDIVAAFLRKGIQNASSMSRIGLGVQQLKSQDVKLDQYTSNQLAAIKRANGTVSESSSTTIAGNPGHKAVFTLGNATKVMQMWTLRGDKAYIMAYQATPQDYPANLPTFQRMVDSLEIK